MGPHPPCFLLQGARCYHQPGGVGSTRMNAKRFEGLVQKALDSIPEEFADLLDNVAVFIEPAPSRTVLRSLGIGRASTLFGLYEGVPQIERTSHYEMVPPDRITIFQRAIEQAASSDAEIEEQVRATVLHEIAHHFGIDDRRLREIERGRRRRR